MTACLRSTAKSERPNNYDVTYVRREANSSKTHSVPAPRVDMERLSGDG